MNEELEKLLRKYWDKSGMCNSCGWHASLYEHDFDWDYWDKDKQYFHFPCQNSDVDDRFDHRGVYVYISDADKKKYAKYLDA